MCFAPQPRALFRHFFDIWTSKSGPRPSVFNTFDLEMCFAPQRRALFQHLNFQKWSEAEVFCTFWLGNVLRATTACTFQHLNFQKWSEAEVFCTFWLGNVLRAPTACTFSTSQLPKVVREWCVLYILTWKCASRHNGVQFFIFHLAHLNLLSSYSFSSNLSLLYASSLLCFSSLHIVGSLTSKLPSNITTSCSCSCSCCSCSCCSCNSSCCCCSCCNCSCSCCSCSPSCSCRVVVVVVVLDVVVVVAVAVVVEVRVFVLVKLLKLVKLVKLISVYFFDILTSKKRLKTLSFLHFWLGNVLRATTACTFSTSQLPKVVREWCVLYILTWKCASRHNGVHFFDISTSKSGPRMVCFVHFDLEMCFAPQRRALFRHHNFQKWSGPGVFCTFWVRNVLRATTACAFRHLNFQKWSEAEVFCTFWLGNVLRATTACTFLTSQLPKVVRDRQFLTLLTSKCASRHNGVQFSSLLWPAGSAPAALASLLFDPPEPQIIGKTQCFATFLPFRASVSSVLLLFLFWSSNLPFLSASALLCFSSLHIVGSLTSKLPSTNYI